MRELRNMQTGKGEEGQDMQEGNLRELKREGDGWRRLGWGEEEKGKVSKRKMEASDWQLPEH